MQYKYTYIYNEQTILVPIFDAIGADVKRSLQIRPLLA